MCRAGCCRPSQPFSQKLWFIVVLTKTAHVQLAAQLPLDKGGFRIWIYLCCSRSNFAEMFLCATTTQNKCAWVCIDHPPRQFATGSRDHRCCSKILFAEMFYWCCSRSFFVEMSANVKNREEFAKNKLLKFHEELIADLLTDFLLKLSKMLNLERCKSVHIL